MEDLKQKTRALTPRQWSEFYSWVLMEERPRREAAAATEIGQAEMIRDLINQGVLSGPEAITEDELSSKEVPKWVDPAGVRDKMYLEGAVVSYEGQVYKSTYQGLNSWEPADDGEVWTVITKKEEIEDDNSDPGEGHPGDSGEPGEPA